MKLITSLVCSALVAGSFGCAPTAGKPVRFHRVTDANLGYVRLATGESAVVWKHCEIGLDGVSDLEVTLGRDPAPSAAMTAAIHDAAAPRAAPLAVGSASTRQVRVTLGAPVRGTRLLTVLEGKLAEQDLVRLLAAMREPDACQLPSPTGGAAALPPDPCKPCMPDVECVPCPPPCPDPPCP